MNGDANLVSRFYFRALHLKSPGCALRDHPLAIIRAGLRRSIVQFDFMLLAKSTDVRTYVAFGRPVVLRFRNFHQIARKMMSTAESAETHRMAERVRGPSM